jgi:hypothetical protein
MMKKVFTTILLTIVSLFLLWYGYQEYQKWSVQRTQIEELVATDEE